MSCVSSVSWGKKGKTVHRVPWHSQCKPQERCNVPQRPSTEERGEFTHSVLGESSGTTALCNSPEAGELQNSRSGSPAETPQQPGKEITLWKTHTTLLKHWIIGVLCPGLVAVGCQDLQNKALTIHSVLPLPFKQTSQKCIDKTADGWFTTATCSTLKLLSPGLTVKFKKQKKKRQRERDWGGARVSLILYLSTTLFCQEALSTCALRYRFLKQFEKEDYQDVFFFFQEILHLLFPLGRFQLFNLK